MVIFNSLMASLHHLSAFTLVACLVYEFVAFRKSLTAGEVRLIQRVDLWYGISAGVLVVVGLLRVFYFEKGASFYDLPQDLGLRFRSCMCHQLFWQNQRITSAFGRARHY